MRGLIFGIAIGIAVAGIGVSASDADAQVVEPEVSITAWTYPFIGAMPCPDDPGYPAGTQKTPGTVTLTRTGPTTEPLNVSYEVDGLVATPSGVATFAAGSATATFTILPTNFFTASTIFATIIDGDGYTLGSPSTEQVHSMMLPILTCMGYPLQVSPPAGDIGTEITVSGSTCRSWDPPTSVDVRFVQVGQTVVASDQVEPDANGAWSTTFIVPDGLDPSASYGFRATCQDETDRVLDYAPATFDLTSPNDTTTTTSTTTTTTVPVSEESTSTTSTAATTSPTTVMTPPLSGNTTSTVAVLAEEDTLPRTGSNTSTLLTITAVLLVAGAALAGSRRRN